MKTKKAIKFIGLVTVMIGVSASYSVGATSHVHSSDCYELHKHEGNATDGGGCYTATGSGKYINCGSATYSGYEDTACTTDGVANGLYNRDVIAECNVCGEEFVASTYILCEPNDLPSSTELKAMTYTHKLKQNYAAACGIT